MITYYRTAGFDKYCKTYSKRSDISLIDTIVSWEGAYRPHIAQPRVRTTQRRFFRRVLAGERSLHGTMLRMIGTLVTKKLLSS